MCLPDRVRSQTRNFGGAIPDKSVAAWKNVFHSTWKTFNTSFKPILNSLKRHRALLMDERLNATILEIQHSRETTVSILNDFSEQSNTGLQKLLSEFTRQYSELSKRLYDIQAIAADRDSRERQGALIQEKHLIAERFGASDYEVDQEEAFSQCFSKSGDWIFEDQIFLHWLNPPVHSNCTLYLHGLPGAGK